MNRDEDHTAAQLAREERSLPTEKLYARTPKKSFEIYTILYSKDKGREGQEDGVNRIKKENPTILKIYSCKKREKRKIPFKRTAKGTKAINRGA